MTYKLIYDRRALKELNKIGKTLQASEFVNKLSERMT